MNLVFHISEDGSEIELKHCASLIRYASRLKINPLKLKVTKRLLLTGVSGDKLFGAGRG